MNLPFDQQTRRFLASVLTTYLGILFAIYLAYQSGGLSGGNAIILAVLALLGALIAERILTYGPLLRYRDRQLSTFFEDYLRLVENDIENTAANDVDVRANIMRPSKQGIFGDLTYEISFWHDESDYSEAEFELEFEIGQGCVGRTHQRGQQMFAISSDHVKGWDDAWGTTAVHTEVAGHLNTIIGTPIYRPSDDEQTKPIAVLIVDSESKFSEFVGLENGQTLADIEFKNTKISTKATNYARNAGILL